MNIDAIKYRLTSLASEEKIAVQVLYDRYFQERFLYRLSISPYREQFILKGGTLLYAWQGIIARPTRDIDLLGRHISGDFMTLKQVFNEILTIEVKEDAVLFDFSSLTLEEITKEGNYKGIRIKAKATLGNVIHKLQVDIGFGDVLTGGGAELVYPTLLDMPAPQLKAYSVEVVIAEKLEAIISLGELNSRMKDFYDVYQLLKKNEYQAPLLKKSIRNTFQARETVLSAKHPVFEKAFTENEKRKMMWEAFLRKSNITSGLAFETVVRFIEEKLKAEELF